MGHALFSDVFGPCLFPASPEGGRVRFGVRIIPTIETYFFQALLRESRSIAAARGKPEKGEHGAEPVPLIALKFQSAAGDGSPDTEAGFKRFEQGRESVRVSGHSFHQGHGFSTATRALQTHNDVGEGRHGSIFQNCRPRDNGIS